MDTSNIDNSQVFTKALAANITNTKNSQLIAFNNSNTIPFGKVLNNELGSLNMMPSTQKNEIKMFKPEQNTTIPFKEKTINRQPEMFMQNGISEKPSTPTTPTGLKSLIFPSFT